MPKKTQPGKRGLQLPYTELGLDDATSPTESFQDGRTSAKRIFKVTWKDRFIARQQLLGCSQVTLNNDGIWVLDRYLPETHPEDERLIVTGVDTEGLGVTLGSTQQTINGRRINKYTFAKLTCTYIIPEYEVLDNNNSDVKISEFYRYVTTRVEPAAEYMAIPQTGVLLWAQGSNSVGGGAAQSAPLPGNIGFVLGNEDYHYTWHQIPSQIFPANYFAYLPHTTFINTIGRVNKTVFAGFDPHTLMLTAYPFMRKNDPRQIFDSEKMINRYWDVEFVMRFNPRGHNNFYDVNATPRGWYQGSIDGTYHAPGSVTDGLLLYDEREFKDLFKVSGV